MTLCRDLHIKQVKLNKEKLEIVGQRVYLFYDSKEKRFRDVAEIADHSNEEYKRLVREQNISIQINLPPNSVDQDPQASMDMLFYSSEEQFIVAAPEFWKPFLEHRSESEVRPKQASSPVLHSRTEAEAVSGGVNHVGEGVSAPTVIYAPDPDYSEAARQSRFQGTVAFNVIIGPDGRVSNAFIRRGLGMGLDEKAVQKLLAWKFKPAIKDGEAVAVEVVVEVQFNLY